MMKRVAVAAVAASALLAAGQAAEAKGCIKGAIVGGIAGHYAGHGVLGAVGGCAAGRALANRQAERQRTAPSVNTGGPVRPSQGTGGYVSYSTGVGAASARGAARARPRSATRRRLEHRQDASFASARTVEADREAPGAGTECSAAPGHAIRPCHVAQVRLVAVSDRPGGVIAIPNRG